MGSFYGISPLCVITQNGGCEIVPKVVVTPPSTADMAEQVHSDIPHLKICKYVIGVPLGTLAASSHLHGLRI